MKKITTALFITIIISAICCGCGEKIQEPWNLLCEHEESIELETGFPGLGENSLYKDSANEFAVSKLNTGDATEYAVSSKSGTAKITVTADPSKAKELYTKTIGDYFEVRLPGVSLVRFGNTVICGDSAVVKRVLDDCKVSKSSTIKCISGSDTVKKTNIENTQQAIDEYVKKGFVKYTLNEENIGQLYGGKQGYLLISNDKSYQVTFIRFDTYEAAKTAADGEYEYASSTNNYEYAPYSYYITEDNWMVIAPRGSLK